MEERRPTTCERIAEDFGTADGGVSSQRLSPEGCETHSLANT
jgi:hypothetical protein